MTANGEGRKKYLESLGILTELDHEDSFESIKGLGPTVAVKQNIIRQSNPRSTVGSRTGILNMLSLLFAADGQSLNGESYEPSFFSYNSANGMCLECGGKGSYFDINLNQLVSDESMTVEDAFLKAGITKGYLNLLKRKYNEYMMMAFYRVPEDIQNNLIYGIYENGKVSYSLMRLFENRFRKGESVEAFYGNVTCCKCNGYRIGEEGRQVLFNHKHIGGIGTMSIDEASEFLKEALKDVEVSKFGKNLLNEILKKLHHLQKCQLGYVSLYRNMSSLSGGELQRLFLMYS